MTTPNWIERAAELIVDDERRDEKNASDIAAIILTSYEKSHPMVERDGYCYYCHLPTSSLAGDPGLWPVVLCHPDEPGVPKIHHERCVSERLHETKVEGLEEAAKIAATEIAVWFASDTPSGPPMTRQQIQQHILSAITPMFEQLQQSHDLLMHRSVAAMHIADGDDNWRAVPLTCPMLDSVFKLKRERDQLRAENERLKAYSGLATRTNEGIEHVMKANSASAPTAPVFTERSATLMLAGLLGIPVDEMKEMQCRAIYEVVDRRLKEANAEITHLKKELESK